MPSPCGLDLIVTQVRGCHKMERTNTAKWVESAKRWQINVQRDGVRRTFTSAKPGRTGQREANKKADEWLDQGLQTRTKTVAAAYDEYLERAAKLTSNTNVRPKASRYTHWIAPRIGGKRLQSLTVGQVQVVLDDAMAAGLSRKTLQNLYGDLTAFFKFCRLNGYCTLVLDGLTVPAGAKKGTRRILQPTEIKKLMRCDMTTYQGKPGKDIFVHAYRIAVLTGLRPGELLGLEWEDVLPDALQVRRSINIEGTTTAGKNDNALRRVDLSAPARAELDAQRAETGQYIRVFPAASENQLYGCWKRYCKYNNITAVSLYELRHTFVSIAQNIPAGMLKSQVGHSKSMDTYGVYAHNVDGQSAADALTDAFAGVV